MRGSDDADLAARGFEIGDASPLLQLVPLGLRMVRAVVLLHAAERDDKLPDKGGGAALRAGVVGSRLLALVPHLYTHMHIVREGARRHAVGAVECAWPRVHHLENELGGEIEGRQPRLQGERLVPAHVHACTSRVCAHVSACTCACLATQGEGLVPQRVARALLDVGARARLPAPLPPRKGRWPAPDGGDHIRVEEAVVRARREVAPLVEK